MTSQHSEWAYKKCYRKDGTPKFYKCRKLEHLQNLCLRVCWKILQRNKLTTWMKNVTRLYKISIQKQSGSLQLMDSPKEKTHFNYSLHLFSIHYAVWVQSSFQSFMYTIGCFRGIHERARKIMVILLCMNLKEFEHEVLEHIFVHKEKIWICP